MTKILKYIPKKFHYRLGYMVGLTKRWRHLNWRIWRNFSDYSQIIAIFLL